MSKYITLVEGDFVCNIPKGMTNGEVIQALFPNIKIWGESKQTLDYPLGGMIHRVTKSWWNAPYQKGGE